MGLLSYVPCKTLSRLNLLLDRMRTQSRIPSPAQQEPTPRGSVRPSDAYARPLTARGASAMPRRDSDSYIPRRAAPTAFKPFNLGSSRACVKELTRTGTGMPWIQRTAQPRRSRPATVFVRT